MLLSDGQSNVGPDPQKAAELAAKYGVRVYTVGMGTTDGVIVKVDGWSMRTRLDEDALTEDRVDDAAANTFAPRMPAT